MCLLTTQFGCNFGLSFINIYVWTDFVDVRSEKRL